MPESPPACPLLVSLPALKTEYFPARPGLSIECRVDKGTRVTTLSHSGNGEEH